jgi:hypothetical protein
MQEYLDKLFCDLKQHLKEFCVDTETQNGLRDQISQLQEANTTLTMDKNTSEVKFQTLIKQLDNTQRDYSKCLGQLKTVSHELENHRNMPKEDPQLLVKIQQLETTRTALEGQLSAEKEEASRAQKKLETLQDRVNKKQAAIDQFDKEKRDMQANFDLEQKKNADSLIKLKSANNETYETKIKRYRQRLTDQEAQTKVKSDELEKLKAEMAQSIKEKNTTELFKQEIGLVQQSLWDATSQNSGMLIQRRLEDLEMKSADIATQFNTLKSKACREINEVFTKQLTFGNRVQGLEVQYQRLPRQDEVRINPTRFNNAGRAKGQQLEDSASKRPTSNFSDVDDWSLRLKQDRQNPGTVRDDSPRRKEMAKRQALSYQETRAKVVASSSRKDATDSKPPTGRATSITSSAMNTLRGYQPNPVNSTSNNRVPNVTSTAATNPNGPYRQSRSSIKRQASEAACIETPAKRMSLPPGSKGTPRR